MKPQEYINSGLLELYVYGVLNDDENELISNMVNKYPEIRVEVEDIEEVLMALSTEVSPSYSPQIKDNILSHIKGRSSFSQPPKNTSFVPYIGWAASILLLGGLLWVLTINNNLSGEVQVANENLNELEFKLQNQQALVANYESTLEILRAKDVTTYLLPGNKPVAPNAYAKAFLNTTEAFVYLDLAGLPDPPEGMVYQIWSLKLDPLTPTSIAVIDDFEGDTDKIFEIRDLPETQAFGITLEPKGGSESPNLEQLYVLGTV